MKDLRFPTEELHEDWVVFPDCPNKGKRCNLQAWVVWVD